jgi:hypothetical protein
MELWWCKEAGFTLSQTPDRDHLPENSGKTRSALCGIYESLLPFGIEIAEDVTKRHQQDVLPAQI